MYVIHIFTTKLYSAAAAAAASPSPPLLIPLRSSISLMDPPQLSEDWPEPVVRVQSLSESGIQEIPERYIKPPSLRPSLTGKTQLAAINLQIPVVDLGGEREEIIQSISEACKEWGFFQLVNHGVSSDLLRRTKDVWREFFYLPLEEKQKYSNTPKTYEGYGSRLGVVKDSPLDWGDYFFLHFLPVRLKDPRKWPSLPTSCRDTIEEYGVEVVTLFKRVLGLMSVSLGLEEDFFNKAFGGEELDATMRVNFYPKCPQPDLTLGFSAHSDPGVITLLLSDDHVKGLQVCKEDDWITVDPIPGAFIVNVADQIQVLTNNTFKSVAHRVIVNSSSERLSMAFFCNPKSDVPIRPAEEFVSPEKPPMYSTMTYHEYRLFVRKNGPQGKSQIQSLATTDHSTPTNPAGDEDEVKKSKSCAVDS